MKTVKTLVILIIISFFIQNIYAQKVFREGYIVKKSGEALNGLVEYSEKQSIPSECTFKRFDIARTVVFSPYDILAFGYRNGNRFESRELDGKVTFFEVIVTGKIVLYQKGSKYFVDKDHHGLVELKNGRLNYNSGDGSKEYRNLPEFLTALTEGRSGHISEKFNLKNDIAPLITEFNKESGVGYNVFNRSFTEKQFTQQAWKSGAAKNRFGVLSGINMYSFKLKFSPEMTGKLVDTYIPEPELEIAPVFGLSYERLLLRSTDRLSVRIDLIYNNQTFYSYSENKNTYGGVTRNDAYFDFKGLKLPLQVQYALTGHRVVPYASLGAAYQYFLSTSYYHLAEIEDITHSIRTTEDRNGKLNSGELTGVAGLGARIRLVRNLNLHFMYRIEIGKGLFKNVDPYEGYGRDLTPYVESSIQHNILIGITF